MQVGIENVLPVGLTSYLNSAGWHAEQSDSRRAIWVHQSGARVFVPQLIASDTLELISIAVHQIATAEQLDEEELTIDLAWSSFDKLHARRETEESSLRFSSAVDFQNALSDLIMAAASAAAEPKKQFQGRRHHSVDEYIEQVRMIPSVTGSFVIRALLPLTKPSTAESLSLIGPADSDVRKVSTTILEASQAAVETARSVASGASLTAWDDVVTKGVSSNLCDALGRLTGEDSDDEGGNVDINIAWTWERPIEAAPRVSIPAGLAPILGAGGDYLRGDPEEYQIRMIGRITQLHRDAPAGPGEVTVKGLIDEWDLTLRSLRIELDQGTYDNAINAHQDGKSVTVLATIRREARLRVVSIQAFDIAGQN
jgi:hypothetical protein